MSMITETDQPDVARSVRGQLLSEGFAVVPAVVPRACCDAVIDAVGEFLALDLRDPGNWYARRLEGHGIVPLHHAQALWDLRQQPALHAVFAALLGQPELWVSHDRVSFKAPQRGWQDPVRTSPVHWDGDPRGERRLRVQGVVYLTDTEPDQGAFCCVPGIYRDLERWLAAHPDDGEIRRPPVDDHEIVRVGAPAGSLILWHRLMPHSSAPNELDTPRFTAYVTMDPTGDEQQREELAAAFLNKTPPAWAIRQQVPGQQNPEPGPPANLTELGRKLTGLDVW
jgi:hypothetical protein